MTTTLATQAPSTNSTRRLLSLGAIAGVAVFLFGWIVAEALEGHGYSVARHDISDLGALTAHYPTLIRATDFVGGLLVILFALFALGPALAVQGRRISLSAVFVAASLPALDTFTDTFFRLDCRAADAGCSTSAATTSWHGKANIAAFAVAGIASVIAPFLLARRMQVLDAWRDLARPVRIFGIVFIAGLVAASATTNSSVGGWAQRIVIIYACAGICALAVRTLRT